MLLGKKKPTAVLPVLGGLALSRSHDTGGFELGVIVDKPRRQATIACRWDSTEPVAEKDKTAWTDAVSPLNNVVAVTTVAAVSPQGSHTRALVTMKSTGDMRRDLDGVLAEVALAAPDFYAPAGLGWYLLPLTPAEVTEWARSTVGAEGKSFPPQPAEFAEFQRYLRVAGSVCVAFELDTTGDIAASGLAELSALVAYSTAEETITVAQIARPTDPRYLEAHPDTPTSRSSAIITITGADREAAESCADELIAALSPRTRIRLHRLLGRQHLGLCISAGLPVFGWQHNHLAGL